MVQYDFLLFANPKIIKLIKSKKRQMSKMGDHNINLFKGRGSGSELLKTGFRDNG